MYQHILVPVDGSDLSIDLVGYAVGLARPVGARISFVHVQGEAADGHVGELLGKSNAAARAAGVPSRSHCVRSDRLAAAIAETASRLGCDLIVVASHASRNHLGTALGADTTDVLMHAGLPVLVAFTGQLQPPAPAIGLIRDEHRCLAAVLHAWQEGVHEALQSPSAAPADLIGAMRAALGYLQRFADEHHPKESQQLFRLLRQRTATLNAELEELDRQHRRDQEWLLLLGAQIERLDGAAAGAQWREGLLRLQPDLHQYIEFIWDHLGREEGVVLPAAQAHLIGADWLELDASFAAARERDGNWAAVAAQSVLSRWRAAGRGGAGTPLPWGEPEIAPRPT